ncbi:TerD family protein [Actinacidiphila paucisporea]|uniref:Stress response protein SCP2 n=1 Tax=Actinacidiphila paucisporea TaxID=310782 RepID=A0A1M6XKD4_9ACTN|nr:TerD family protein [Actinacidiphila paucisporea]SHL06462.1 Stress response protein SCP2 [Actinacidiphila paucisporea]
MTHVMVKGSNVPLDAPGIRAVLRWSPGSGTPDVDASVLLLGSDGRVRSDDDFVFYNEPRHPSGLARHLPKQRVAEGLTDTVEVDLAALEAGIDRVVIAASCDGGSFRQVRDLCVLLYDTSGPRHAPLVTFDVHPDTGGETALNCGELYRKDGGWKFRAVGQGYTTGLVGLATEFGITVDDMEPDADRADPPAQPQGAPSQASEPTRAQQPDLGPTSAYGYPLPSPAGGHVPAQPAYGYPQPVAAVPPPPTAPPVHQQPQPGYPAYGYPQPVGAAAAAGGATAFTLPPQGPQFQPGR